VLDTLAVLRSFSDRTLHDVSPRCARERERTSPGVLRAYLDIA
jgi:hypothetical protein